MAFYQTIRNYILERFGKSDAPASVLLPTGEEDYPTFIQNEGMGGSHGFDSVAEMLQMKRGRMYVPMLAVVKGNDVYILKQLPPDGVERLSDMELVNVADYWMPLKLGMTFPVQEDQEPPQDGEDGDDGLNGWTGIPSLVSDGPRLVLAFMDYVGGTGAKPNPGYVGPNGIVGNIKDAVDLIAKIQLSLNYEPYVVMGGNAVQSVSLPIYPKVVGTASVVNNNSSMTRNVYLCGQSMARPDSSVEDTVKISIWYSENGGSDRDDWKQVPRAVWQSRIKDQVQLTVVAWDRLTPGQTRFYRTQIETVPRPGENANYSEYSDNPSTFISVF